MQHRFLAWIGIPFFVLGCIGRANAADGASDPAACERYAPIPVTVHTVFDAPTFDDSKNLSEIRDLTSDPSRTIPHYDAVTLGVTRYEPVFEIKAPMLQQALPDGTFCARAAYMDVTVGYRNVVVYIASDFADNACAHDHILTHEMKHVEVNRQVLAEHAPKIRKQFEDWAKLYGLFIVANPDFARQLLAEKAQALFHEASASIMEDNQARQRAIDTPREYATSQTACRGAIAQAARAFLADHTSKRMR